MLLSSGCSDSGTVCTQPLLLYPTLLVLPTLISKGPFAALPTSPQKHSFQQGDQQLSKEQHLGSYPPAGELILTLDAYHMPVHVGPESAGARAGSEPEQCLL